MSTISYVVVTENNVRHAGPILDVIAEAKSDGDEAILLTRSDHVGDLSGPPRPWLRVVGIPDANIFTLRAQLPAVARKDWVLLVEEHSLVTQQTLLAVQDVIAKTPGIDLVVFLGKNLQAVTKWAWANFVHTFALVWAPLDHPPPFSPVTAAVVRREAIGTEHPLQEGEWELRLIPRIFETGRFAYSNDIYIDHFRPLNALSCFLLNFHNARAGAALQRRLGVRRTQILREGRNTRVKRPYALDRAIAPRSHELPAPMLGPLRVIGWAFHLGMIAGVLLGAGRSGHKLD
jgi:hypothetical protein